MRSRLSSETSRFSRSSSIPFTILGTLNGLSTSTVGSRGSSSLLSGFTFDLLRVSVEEEIGEDGPAVGLTTDGSSETEDFSAEEVPDLKG